MNTSKHSSTIFTGLSFLLLLLLGMMGCGKSVAVDVEPQTTEVSEETTHVKEVDVGETDRINLTPSPETLTYTNQVYGFELEHPKTWSLSEGDHEVVLMNDPNRLSIRFQWVDEQLDPYSGRTGIPAGDLIYEDKILFMDQVIPAEYLIFEKKYKAVFYGGTSWIEIDDLLFWIELVDLETGDYREIDLSEELLTEAKSIVESFKPIDREDDSVQGPSDVETGLIAHLEIPERLTIGEKINLKFVLKNVSNTPLYVLNWYTPLEGIGGEIFEVSREGQALPYEGILASRTPPTPDVYVLLEPSQSVSAVVGLSGAFDFSLVGRYRIKFISPHISHIARTEVEMAKTMEELGPVNIPSNEVSLELVESTVSEGLPRLHTPEEAQEMIESFLRDLNLDLGIEPILPVEELHTDGLWRALETQVFRVTEGKFLNESFLIWGSHIIQLGTALGGQGLTSLVVADIDQNGQAELIYAYSYGSDIIQSRIGMYSHAYHECCTFEADIGYHGHLRVYSEDESHVGVQVIEVDQDTKTIQFQDTIGYLFIEQIPGNVVLGLKIYKFPPENILEKIFTTQDSSQD